MIFLIVLGLLVVLSSVAFALGKRFGRARRAAMQAYASTRGFTYTPADNSYADQPWGPPFDTTDERGAAHVLTGTVGGRPVVSFEYTRVVASSNGSRREVWTVASVRLPAVLPEVRVRRPGVGPDAIAAYGVRPVALESERFNKTYSPIAHDRKTATDVLHPRMMEWLLEVDAPGFVIHGADLVLVRKGPTVFDRLDADLAYLNGVVDRIPNFVWTR